MGSSVPNEDATLLGVTLLDEVPGPIGFFAACLPPWTTAHIKPIGQQKQTRRGKGRKNSMGSTKKYAFFEENKPFYSQLIVYFRLGFRTEIRSQSRPSRTSQRRAGPDTPPCAPRQPNTRRRPSARHHCHCRAIWGRQNHPPQKSCATVHETIVERGQGPYHRRQREETKANVH